jgi:DNA gyrase inhibitor GyrI
MLVKIVQLPRFRAAAFHVKESATPEHDAWEQLEAWARPRGFFYNPTEYQIYGRNNPSPLEQCVLRGYEFWVTIPDDYKLDDSVSDVSFPGGLYAAVQSKGIPDMIQNYEKIFDWIKASGLYTPDYPDGYDYEHAPGLELEHNLAPQLEGEDALLMEVYVPIRLREEDFSVRIIELPPVKMARSGGNSLEAFNQWWSTLAALDKHNLFPRDFMWFNPRLNDFEWLYALPEGLADTGGYEVFDFPGGLYAVAACRDDGAEIEKTNKRIHEWIARSEIVTEEPQVNNTAERYDMGHVITPLNAKATIGYHQMDLFVPVVYQKAKISKQAHNKKDDCP